MNPYELLSPAGKPCGVFCCGKCNAVLAEDLAEKCCKPCECGKETMNRFQAECNECYRKRLNDRRHEQLREAEEIEWDGEMMLLSEDLPNHRDGWYTDPEDVAEAIHWRKQEEPGFEPPEFVFASTRRTKGLNLNSAIENMLDDTHEDADWPSKSAVAELQKHVDVFNAKESITFFEPDYKRKVRIVGVESPVS